MGLISIFVTVLQVYFYMCLYQIGRHIALFLFKCYREGSNISHLCLVMSAVDIVLWPFVVLERLMVIIQETCPSLDQDPQPQHSPASSS